MIVLGATIELAPQRQQSEAGWLGCELRRRIAAKAIRESLARESRAQNVNRVCCCDRHAVPSTLAPV